ncbi:MAG: hypothetical protein KDD42_07430 [Bdellovibrionales bacterium]|nr:hypothetical protein [Bdellovibrionales bacterium]
MIKLRNEGGATIIEYIIGLAILVPIAIIISNTLIDAASNRIDDSSAVERRFVPCGPGGALLPDECF